MRYFVRTVDLVTVPLKNALVTYEGHRYTRGHEYGDPKDPEGELIELLPHDPPPETEPLTLKKGADLLIGLAHNVPIPRLVSYAKLKAELEQPPPPAPPSEPVSSSDAEGSSTSSTNAEPPSKVPS